MHVIFVEMQGIILSMWKCTIQIKLTSPDLISDLYLVQELGE